MLKKNLGKWLIVAMTLMMAAGCSPSTTKMKDENEKGQTVVQAFSSKGPRITSFNDNLLTQKIEKKLDIDLVFSTAPSEGAKKKQNLLLASGDYPPAFMGGEFSKVDQLKYGKLGVFLPLNDLIKEYAPNVQKAFNEKPWLKEGVTTPDGNIYGLPGISGCYHCSFPLKFWINTEWLKNLNLDMPKTTDEFEQVLTAFKEEDPNGNGKKDEIPLSGQTSDEQGNPINFLMNAFIYTNPDSYLRVVDHKIDFVADGQKWKQGLAYIRDLYAKGLIDPQAFTQNKNSLKQLGNKEGDAVLGTFPALWNGGTITIGPANDKRWTDYAAVPPLKGPEGVQLAMYNGKQAPEAKFVITDKASEKQQIAAIKVANYLYSREGALEVMFGVKGKGWVPAEEGKTGINGKPAIFQTTPEADDWNKPSKDLWENGFKYMPTELFNGQAVSQDTSIKKGNEVLLYQQTKEKYEGHQPEETASNFFINEEKAQEIAQLRTVIQDYIKQNSVQFIMGKKDLNSQWEAYIEGLKNLNLKKYMEIYQEAYEANKK